jgi:hypothetical protein
MIGARQLKLIEHARRQVELAPEQFDAVIREEGGVRTTAELSIAGFNGAMDRLTVLGFRDRRRPVLSSETLAALDGLFQHADMTAFEVATQLRRYGSVSDLRELDGDGLLRLLILAERRGAVIAAFIERRRSVSHKQLALLHVARAKVDYSKHDLLWALQHLGGVNSAADLDQRGFELLMAALRDRGFRPKVVEHADVPTFGRRPGFASPEQLTLICDLWAEWSGASDEVALNAWLDRYQGVTNLRFLTAAKAGKAITALKAMKARDGKKRPEQVSA